MSKNIFRIFNPGGQSQFVQLDLGRHPINYFRLEPKENPVEKRRAQLRRAQQ